MSKLEQAGIKAVKLLQAQDFKAFFVGGFVRNNLLKLSSDNIDIATDATPDEVEKVLNTQKIKVKPVGKKFGSILAIVDGFAIEITTFRKEGRYSDNRHPDQVEFIKEYLDDAKRRDFTINALYFDPIKKELFDPTNGLKDLKGKLLKFVGDPKKRIDEDALRMLRGVRLATQLGFKLEKNSFAAIKTRAKYIQDISGERVRSELDKILMSINRGRGIRLLQETGLLKFIIPEFEKLRLVNHHAKTYHLEGPVSEHIFKAVEILQINDLALIYATFFHDVGKVLKPQKVYEGEDWKFTFKGHVKLSGEIFTKFAAKYRFSKETKDLILFLIQYHDHKRWFLELPIEKQIGFLLDQTRPELLIELWRVDSAANLRIKHNKLVWGKTKVVPAAQAILAKILKAKNYFNLASGYLIMKYSKLKPGRELGQKVEDVKVQIVLGKIKSEKDLKNYLSA